MCLYNIVAVAVFYIITTHLILLLLLLECMNVLLRYVRILVLLLWIKRWWWRILFLSVAPSLLEKVSSESNIHLPHTQTRRNWKIDHHHHYHYDHLI